MTEAVDHSVLGIIDESEPDAPDEVDADYSREDADPTEESDPTSIEAEAEDTPDELEDPEGEDSVEATDDAPDEDTHAEEEGGTDEEDSDGPILFAGREWDSLEQIEQSFKSWEGRIGASEEKVRDYETRLTDYYEYVQEVGKENEQLRARLSGEAPAPEGTPAPAAEKPVGVNMKRILNVAKLAEERHGIDKTEAALKLYDEEMRAVMDGRLSEMEQKLSQPFETAKDQALTAQAEREFFSWGQGTQAEDGSARYPMLQADNLDEGFVSNVYEAWQAIGQKFGPQYQFSQLGLDQAYSLAERYAIQTGEFEYADPTPSTVRTPSRRMANSDAEAASDLTGETPSLSRPKKSGSQTALEELGAHKEVTIGGESLGFYE